ncbi:MAG TPA: type II secretion system protein GspG, partial [Thermodesulfovibrionales bacterium]|nr:type II secretion system protein GspG [Thermodesulfovibrionales bacterium]
DPWGNPYIYVCPGLHGDYDVVSYGADGKEGGEGKNADITSWDMK